MSELATNDDFLHDRNILKMFKYDGNSQFGQDIFIWKIIFNCCKEGFFLDIGGNDPIHINNTYLFEQKGWKGLAFEPIKELQMKWDNVRKTECLNLAIGDCDNELEFTELKYDAFSGMSTAISFDDEQVKSKYVVQQKTLTSVLKERKISKVDFMSVDVEGYEMNVLKGIDFSQIDISCICIENNREGDDRADMELRSYLISKGYRLIARLTIDDVFVKEDFINSKIFE